MGVALEKWLMKNRHMLAAGAGGAALAGGAVAAKPMMENVAANLAMDKIKRDAKHAMSDTADFVGKHPLVASAAMTGAGALGATSGTVGVGGAIQNLINGLGEEPGPRRRR